MLTRDAILADRYQIEEEIGRGGMARVYRATDTVLGRTVAVKVLGEDYALDPTFVERFRREAQAAARLNHANVVSVFDTGSDGAVHFIIMEFVEGRTLADVMTTDGPLDPERAAEIAMRIAEALSFAHAEGLVHRDIKPANVMITDRGRVKVMDFGIARLATSNTITQTSTVFGTAAYLAPEQAQGQRVDGRADVYALGVVLYEMLAGRVPFVADSAVAVASKHVLEQPQPPSQVRAGVPPALEAIAMRALEKDPDDRFADAGQMASALGQSIGLSAVTTEPLTGTAAHDRTAVLPVAVPPSRRGTHAAPGRPPRWWIPIVLFAVGAVLLALFLPALLSRNDTGTNVTPPATHQPSHKASAPAPATSAPATSAPATTAPPTTAPPTTPVTTEPSPEPPPATSVEDAAAGVAAALASAESAGAIDDTAARDVQHGIDESLKKYDDGDLDRALEEIQHAQDRLADSVEKEKTSPEAGSVISAAFDTLASAMQASPPEGGDERGNNDEQGGPGPG
jgi:serine/threonine-protein kinase